MTIAFLQTFVAERFFVSTVYRRCSAALAPDLWYFETIVWAWDERLKAKGEMLDTLDSGRSADCAAQNHCRIVANYFETVANDYVTRMEAERERVNQLTY